MYQTNTTDGENRESWVQNVSDVFQDFTISLIISISLKISEYLFSKISEHHEFSHQNFQADHAGNTKNPCSNSNFGTVWTARSAAALPDQSGQLDPMAPLRRAPRPSRVSCGKFWRPWLQRRRKDAEILATKDRSSDAKMIGDWNWQTDIFLWYIHIYICIYIYIQVFI